MDNYLIPNTSSVREALQRLNMSDSQTIFVIRQDQQLLGSITDGDIRRGLLGGIELSESVEKIMNMDFSKIVKNDYSIEQIKSYKKKALSLIPLVDKTDKLLSFINLKGKKSFLPIDALIMAGGKGTRLRPLTDNIPKPLLMVNNKPIIEYNIDRLNLFGIKNLNISIKYLGQQLIDYFGSGDKHGVNISYIEEDQALGTIGALALVENLENDTVLIMNSDLLTNIDFEDFYKDFVDQVADMSIASIPYKVEIPYAILKTEGTEVKSFAEKPTITYYSNGGIYLLKKEHISKIPKGAFFNATDLMDELIHQGNKVISYPLRGYWLDIGKHDDFAKAQEDVKHIQF
ncbi:nucleotidyltransferase family protein [Reichenbachiella carrageenanivorans]|uniref:Nucleotidyltransferase family protein n=1 Tax=Reichenbachiella carrageenanivorans TaxID=2979869 RepID=A0ABY6D366_9BACT|nr:nucleotidyltransferase family protein [Reichenbachiella carrageenanivorans]UXX80602.1 nucleotidyltransferase family protein [Reichenbachiella carrageenanivorans]